MLEIGIGIARRPENPRQFTVSCYSDADRGSLATFIVYREGLFTEDECDYTWELFRKTIPLAPAARSVLLESHCEVDIDAGDRLARESFSTHSVATGITRSEWTTFLHRVQLRVVVTDETGEQLGQNHNSLSLTIRDELMPSCPLRDDQDDCG